jgi:hypothetical protein
VPDNDRSHDFDPLPFATRFWFAWIAWLRVLFDGAFAGRVWSVRHGMPALPEPRKAERKAQRKEERKAERKPAREPAPSNDAALVLLALLQREGRLLDFLEQDITSFEDAEVGAAVRVVHEGCKKALHAAATIEPVRDEEEESNVVVPKGYDAGAVKLTGKVAGKPPYNGVLRHRGWRVRKLALPHAVEGHDATIVAPAEVELS